MFGFKKTKDVLRAGLTTAKKYTASSAKATMNGLYEYYPPEVEFITSLTVAMGLAVAMGVGAIGLALGFSVVIGLGFAPQLISAAVALVAGAVGAVAGVTKELNKPSEQNPVPQMTPPSPDYNASTILQKKAACAFRAVAKAGASPFVAVNTNKTPVIQAKNRL